MPEPSGPLPERKPDKSGKLAGSLRAVVRHFFWRLKRTYNDFLNPTRQTPSEGRMRAFKPWVGRAFGASALDQA